MKYFTPERYLRFGDVGDEKNFLAAQVEWEAALAAYQRHRQAIRKQLPTSLPKTLESVYLHDAVVLSMHQNKSAFVITLEPESDPGRLVVFRYSLVEDPVIDQQALPAAQCSEPVSWLYDELDLDRPEEPRGLPPTKTNLTFRHNLQFSNRPQPRQRERSSSPKPTFRHNILLSNGWEVALRFRTASAHRPVRIVPVAPELRSA